MSAAVCNVLPLEMWVHVFGALGDAEDYWSIARLLATCRLLKEAYDECTDALVVSPHDLCDDVSFRAHCYVRGSVHPVSAYASSQQLESKCVYYLMRHGDDNAVIRAFSVRPAAHLLLRFASSCNCNDIKDILCEVAASMRPWYEVAGMSAASGSLHLRAVVAPAIPDMTPFGTEDGNGIPAEIMDAYANAWDARSRSPAHEPAESPPYHPVEPDYDPVEPAYDPLEHV